MRKFITAFLIAWRELPKETWYGGGISIRRSPGIIVITHKEYHTIDAIISSLKGKIK